MAITPQLRNRISKLIPRLGSNHDGEVLATRNAIQRALKTEGANFSDLASVVRIADCNDLADVIQTAETRDFTTQGQPAYDYLWDTVRHCEQKWLHLKEPETKLVRRVKWRLSRGREIEAELREKIERLARLLERRRRIYKTKGRVPAAYSELGGDGYEQADLSGRDAKDFGTS
jgi:hypothetical protein